jgi:drug/metabolite transporter (DMT)-like permease
VTIVLGLCAALIFALSDLQLSRISNVVRAPVVLAWALGVGSLLLLPVALLTGGFPERASLDYGAAALAGVFYVAGLGAFLVALSRGQLSVVAPIAALEGGIAASLAILLGETVTAVIGAGLLFALLGGVLTASEPGARSAAGVEFALLAAAAIAVTFVLFGVADSLPAPTAALISRVCGLAVALPVALSSGGLAVPREARARVFAIGVLEATAFVAIAAAVARGPVAIAAMAAAQGATMAVLLGLFVLGERLHRRQKVGLVFTIAAVTILAGTQP